MGLPQCARSYTLAATHVRLIPFPESFLTRSSTMANPQPMLGPVIALVAWTAVMWGWMYATRIPAILRLRIRQSRRKTGRQVCPVGHNRRY